MVAADLSTQILHALTEAFSGAGFDLVTQVEVRRGWGDIEHCTVHTRLAQSDASPDFRQTIQEVVATVLKGGRYHVEIRWTGS